jgi:hypothetical protein
MPTICKSSRRRLALAAASSIGIAGFWGGTAAAASVAPAMDDAFRASAASIAQSLSAGDSNGALQQSRALAAQADQPYEKYTAGQLMLQAATNKADLHAERVALNLILESGAAPDARTAELRADAGVLSAMLGDFKDAFAQVQYANKLGVATVPSQIALAEAGFQTGSPDVGNAALEQAMTLQAKDGKAVEESWYDRAIALSYQRKRNDLALQWTQRKLAAYGGAKNWRSGAVNLMTETKMEPDQSLDLWRLLNAVNGLASERDWEAYAAVAAQKGAYAEAKAVLDAGVKNGAIASGDTTVQKLQAQYKPKAASALAAIPGLASKAKSSQTAAAAMAAGDAQMSAASYPAAVESYRLALTRADVDKDRAQTLLGVALARSGDLDGAKAALSQVGDGAWTPVAGMWSTWVDRKKARNPD